MTEDQTTTAPAPNYAQHIVDRLRVELPDGDDDPTSPCGGVHVGLRGSEACVRCGDSGEDVLGFLAARRAQDQPFSSQSDCCDDTNCPCHDNDDPTGDRWADDVAKADRPAGQDTEDPDALLDSIRDSVNALTQSVDEDTNIPSASDDAETAYALKDDIARLDALCCGGVLPAAWRAARPAPAEEPGETSRDLNEAGSGEGWNDAINWLLNSRYMDPEAMEHFWHMADQKTADCAWCTEELRTASPAPSPQNSEDQT